ncbi:fimbrial protein [Serratia sp. UGAL515B_01]|uniref:fimbrial protein n=1 Tax=Serratia sp. UGAL515B_01 TaxID=2986763 RepID=UPI002955402D|nr:fimbrial protein [Serratia sp. UGAL515B_01]WON76482.1 fimbrial protein [Serratia sp. UGAL515B_01]
MKKNFLIVFTACALSASTLADDGKINFYGTITDVSCTVVNDVSNPLTVTMGTVSSKAFTGAGSTAAPTRFTLLLKNCPSSVKSAVVKFDGIPALNDDTVLALSKVTGMATNVGIQITDNQRRVVPLFTPSSSYPLNAGENNLNFVARYYATGNKVTSGPANATSNFTIIYN